MKIAEVLKGKGSAVAVIDPEVSLGVAVKTMSTKGIGALVVSRDGEHIAGIVSERDVVKALADDPSACDRRVAEVMTRDVVTVRPDETVTGAMALMTRRRHRHLPVVVDGRLAGIVSIGDLVKARLEELELESRVLREVYLATH
jgi:CBS domain-containing protein